MNFALWLPLVAALLGAILHSLSDDGGASILDHFGITWRVPTAVLPLAVLGFGVASGFVDNLQGGADWQHALVTALTTSLGTIFGAVAQHGLVNRTGGSAVKAAILFIGAGALVIGIQACTKPAQSATSADITCVADDVIINGVTDPAQVLKDCPNVAPDIATDIDQIVAGLLGTSKDLQTPANVQKRAAVVAKDGGK